MFKLYAFGIRGIDVNQWSELRKKWVHVKKYVTMQTYRGGL